jgi:class 3 adenylate cyclase
MNVTSRIEDATGPEEVLAADSTVAALSGRATVAESRELQARGIDEALRVHLVTGYTP